MKNNTSITLRLAAAASVVLAGAALAHPHEGVEGKENIQKVIVFSSKHDVKDADKRIREFRMLRGANGEFSCPNGEQTEIDETTDGDRIKILICSDDKLSSADRAKKVEEMLVKLRSENHFGAEHKAKVESALQEAIDKLRASN